MLRVMTKSDLTIETSACTSSSLLGRVRQCDAVAWDRLTQLYGPLIYRWARDSHLQSQDAADIVQEVFHAVATNIASFEERRDGASFRGWLWGIAKNKIADHFRRRASGPQATGGTRAQQQLEQLPASPPEDASEASSINVTSALVQRALDLIQTDFSEHTWRTFLRATIEGHAAGEIAVEMGMSMAAVYKAKSRVLARLREELSGLE